MWINTLKGWSDGLTEIVILQFFLLSLECE